MILGKGYYWIEADEDGEYTGNMCSAYYGESDKPTVGNWILVKKTTIEIETENTDKWTFGV